VSDAFGVALRGEYVDDSDGYLVPRAQGTKLVSGTLTLGASAYAPKHPAAAWRAGVAYLPGDRTGEGLISDFSVLDNVVMARPPRRIGWFDAREARRNAAHLGARIEIYRVIRSLADEGVAVLLVSDDLPELIGLSDRLAVMRGGRIEHTFAAGDTPDETTIVRHMT
jgi:ABC-type sugar transport system ATPase subunit